MATRTDHLARPRPNLLKFPDRHSVYWLDELPKSKNTSTTVFELTPRLEQLAQSKQTSRFFQESRRTPEWTVHAAALKACPSQRVCSLALPRLPAEGWESDRPLPATLSVAVKTAEASPRVCQLAHPKRVKMVLSHFRVDSNAHAETFPTTTPSAPSARIQQLASPKQVHPQHALTRPVSWPVPDCVLKAVASERLQVLARPKTRQALFEGYEPYRITPAARAATASPRLLELSLPLPRKCKGQ